MQFRYLRFVFLTFTAVGCTRERVYENIYDGLQKREQMVHLSGEPTLHKLPGYEAYKRQRTESLKIEDGDTR